MEFWFLANFALAFGISCNHCEAALIQSVL